MTGASPAPVWLRLGAAAAGAGLALMASCGLSLAEEPLPPTQDPVAHGTPARPSPRAAARTATPGTVTAARRRSPAGPGAARPVARDSGSRTRQSGAGPEETARPNLDGGPARLRPPGRRQSPAVTVRFAPVPTGGAVTAEPAPATPVAAPATGVLSAPPAAAATPADVFTRLVSGLGGPLADYLQGALLLARRSTVSTQRAPACVTTGDCSGRNLSGRNLSGLDLSGVDFTNANLSRANLSGANLTSARIIDANLYRADLSNAILTGQNLSGKDLRYGNFQGADLTGAMLRGSQLQSANLSTAVLAGADLAGAQFWCAGGGFACRGTPSSVRYTYGANLSGADFTAANLSGADLTGAFLDGANFTNANLTAAAGKCSEQGPGRSCSGGFSKAAYGLTLIGANLTDVVDLAGADLAGKDLSGVTLTGTDLTGAYLTNANLQRAVGLASANLAGARLSGVNLSNLDLTAVTGLTGRDLTGAVLSGANLTGVNLSGAILADVTLTGATLNGTVLVNADLSGADLAGLDLNAVVWRPYPAAEVNLSGADLTGANLSRQYLDGADLSYATLVGASLPRDLSGADLYGAVLTGLNLTGTNLSAADLTRANLTGVNLTDANLTDAVLRGTVVTRVIWSNTTCPDGSTTGRGCNVAPVQSYLALQGGGLKALTTDAGVIAGALQYLKQQGALTGDGTPVTSLADLFSVVKTVSANSGGSWFASFLGYNPQFAAQLENPDTFFGPGGYMDLAKTSYNNYTANANIGSIAEFDTVLGGLFTAAGAAVGAGFGGPAGAALGAFFGRLATIPVGYALYQVPVIRQAVTLFGKAQQGDLSWQHAMSEMIFAPLGLRDLQNISFSDATGRTAALQNANLVFQASLGTGGAVLAHQSGLGFLLQGANDGFSVNEGNDKYLPVLLSSMTNGAVAPPTLPTVNGALRGYYETPGQMHLGNFNYARQDVSIDPFTFAGSVWTATNASSAALGMLGNWSAMNGTAVPGIIGGLEAGMKLAAAPVLLFAGLALAPITLLASIPLTQALLVLPWTPLIRNVLAWQERDLAVPVNVNKTTNTIVGGPWKVNDFTTVEGLAADPILRLSDGGYTDNTSIAAQLKTMQVNGDLSNGFEITYISDTSTKRLTPLNGESIDRDFVDLFGSRGTLTTPGSDFGLSTPHDSPDLFSANQIGGLTPMWSYSSTAPSGGHATTVTYREITVTTDAGNVYGLPAGVRGKINLIQVLNDDTDSLPILKEQSGDTGFGHYRELFDAVMQGMAAGGGAYVGDALADTSTSGVGV